MFCLCQNGGDKALERDVFSLPSALYTFTKRPSGAYYTYLRRFTYWKSAGTGCIAPTFGAFLMSSVSGLGRGALGAGGDGTRNPSL